MPIPPRTRGGKRENAGRKRNPETILKDMEVEARISKAQDAFEFEYKLLNNPKVPWGVRLAAAQDIQDRVFGKPKQATTVTFTKSLPEILKEFCVES
jgi:hypothetical protein